VTDYQLCYQASFPTIHVYVTYSNGYTWLLTTTIGGSGWFSLSDPEPSGVEPGMPAKGWPADINCDIVAGMTQATDVSQRGYYSGCFVVPPGVM
jgi:hypothetical protein